MVDDNGPRTADRSRRGRRGDREPATIDLTAERVTEEPVGPAPEASAPPPPGGEPSTPAASSGEDATLDAIPDAVPAEPGRDLGAEPAPEAVAGPLDDPAVDPAATGIPADPATEPVQEPMPEHEPVAAVAPDPVLEPVAPPLHRAPRPQRGLPLALGLMGGVVGAALTVLLLSFMGPLADAPDRLTALEASVGDKATRRTVDALDKRVAANEAAAQALRGDLDAASKRPQVSPSDLAPLTQRIDRLDRAVAQIPVPSADPAAPPPPPPPIVVAGRESAALAVAMLVRDQVARGLPYAREVNALEQAGLMPDAVAKLKPFAAEGAPSAAALATAFAPLNAALAAPREAPADANLVEKVSALFARVVKVRPVGNARGDEPAAIGARADAALRRGDMPAALAALESLPAPEKSRVQPFIDRLAARLAAGQAADSLVAAAVDQVIAATANSGVPAR